MYKHFVVVFLHLADICLVGGGERVTVDTSRPSLFYSQTDFLSPINVLLFSVGPVAVTESPAPFPVVSSSSAVAWLRPSAARCAAQEACSTGSVFLPLTPRHHHQQHPLPPSEERSSFLLSLSLSQLLVRASACPRPFT